MPGRHSAKTKLLGFYADSDLVDEIDSARGPNSRSDFLRDATVEYLRQRKISIPEAYRRAPDRTGKGGRYPATRSESLVPNEPTSAPPKQPESPADAAGSKLLRRQAAKIRRRRKGPGRGP
jgi:hypothetical protein